MLHLTYSFITMASLLFDVYKAPRDEEEFIKWMEAKFNVVNGTIESNYDSNAARMLNHFQNDNYWRKVGEQLKEWNTEYYKQNGVNLFVKIELPPVVIKPYNSLLNKAFRKNCLKNKAFPNEPEGGWVSPETWYDKIHDIIRTSFTVKYLDGVKFLVQKLEQVAEALGYDYTCTYEAHDDGYYAAHAALRFNMDIIGMDWRPSTHLIEVEIQITTELQEMVKRLLHKYYEDNRRKVVSQDYKWQWDYDSEQFVPNYLGHIAHYLEGMIVEIRDKQK